MTDSTDKHARTSLVMRADIAVKLERMVDSVNGSTANSLLNALIWKLTPEAAMQVFAEATAAGVVKRRAKADPQRSAALRALEALSPEEIIALVERKKAGGGA